jgi:hypothetical protein
VLTALAHRPFHPQSVEHKNFIRKQREVLQQLSVEFPGLDFGKELKQLADFDAH